MKLSLGEAVTAPDSAPEETKVSWLSQVQGAPRGPDLGTAPWHRQACSTQVCFAFQIPLGRGSANQSIFAESFAKTQDRGRGKLPPHTSLSLNRLPGEPALGRALPRGKAQPRGSSGRPAVLFLVLITCEQSD